MWRLSYCGRKLCGEKGLGDELDRQGTHPDCGESVAGSNPA